MKTRQPRVTAQKRHPSRHEHVTSFWGVGFFGSKENNHWNENLLLLFCSIWQQEKSICILKELSTSGGEGIEVGPNGFSTFESKIHSPTHQFTKHLFLKPSPYIKTGRARSLAPSKRDIIYVLLIQLWETTERMVLRNFEQTCIFQIKHQSGKEKIPESFRMTAALYNLFSWLFSLKLKTEHQNKAPVTTPLRILIIHIYAYDYY